MIIPIVYAVMLLWGAFVGYMEERNDWKWRKKGQWQGGILGGPYDLITMGIVVCGYLAMILLTKSALLHVGLAPTVASYTGSATLLTILAALLIPTKKWAHKKSQQFFRKRHDEEDEHKQFGYLYEQKKEREKQRLKEIKERKKQLKKEKKRRG